MKSKYTGIKRILKAFTYSYDGFIAVFKSEAAFRQDLIVFILGITICLFLPVTYLAKLLMIFSLFLIIIMELVNSAIEVIIDRISQEYHPLSKTAKDIGSLLVLLSFMNAIIIWFTILMQIFFESGF